MDSIKSRKTSSEAELLSFKLGLKVVLHLIEVEESIGSWFMLIF
jgi:hypothetical protein